MAGSSRFPWILAVAGALAAALLGWVLMHRTPAPRIDGPSITAVEIAHVEIRDVAISVNALGQAQGWQAVVVRAQTSGRLLQVPVREGSEVAVGDLIAEIDPAPHRAALMQAQGALRRDQAQLDIAELRLARYRQLADQKSIAGLDVDTQAALVDQLKGTVMLDQGALAAAQANLNYTRIVAPVAGRVGMRLVDAGNVVSANDTGGIVTINQISPIAVAFTLPQGVFQRLAQASEGLRKPLVTQAYSQETGQLQDTGELVVVDNRVDPSTASVQLKARLANRQHRLWPGQLLNVKLTLLTLHDALTLPSIAVNQGPQGPFTYVVVDGKARLQPLQIEVQQDELTVVRSGVKPGDIVVVEGQASLRPDARVSVRKTPDAAAGAAASPQPRP